MFRNLVTTTLVCAVFALSATIAEAHPRLKMATPAPGAKLATAPKMITMRFSEGLIGNFSGLEVKDARGRKLATGQTMLDANDNTKLSVPLNERLTAGTYMVAWHAVSVDTHRVAGHYSFKVTR